MTATALEAPRTPERRGLLLIGAAIVLTAFNLRTAVNSVGPVLAEIRADLSISSGGGGGFTAGPPPSLPRIWFAGPPPVAPRPRAGGPSGEARGGGKRRVLGGGAVF